MRKIAVLLCLISYLLVAQAQSENTFERNKLSLGAGLTSGDTWQIDVSYHYMISPYVGVGASVGMWKQFATDGIPRGKGWRIADDYEKTANFYLRPSLHIVSPTLMKISDGNLKLFLQPGFMMNIPYSHVPIHLLDEHGIERDVKNISTTKGKWYAFDCKTGLSLNVDNISISLGYQYSTLDVFAMRRNLTYDNKRFNDFYPKRKSLHGGFLSFSYSF